MGKVTLNEKFKKYTGTLPPNGHRFYLTNRYGQTIISHCPKNRDPNSLTENQKDSNNEFAQARLIADAELDDFYLNIIRSMEIKKPKYVVSSEGYKINDE